MAIDPWQKKMQRAADTGEYFVIFSFGKDCPVCKQYLPVLEAMNTIYSKYRVYFIGLAQDLGSFELLKEKGFLSVLDTHSRIAVRALKMKVMPEVVFTNYNGKVLYNGAIDDWVINLKVKKKEPEAFYLKDAIESQIERKKILRTYTTPIGCFLENIEEGIEVQ